MRPLCARPALKADADKSTASAHNDSAGIRAGDFTGRRKDISLPCFLALSKKFLRGFASMLQGADGVAVTPTAGLRRTIASGRETRTRTRELRRAAASDSYVIV